MRWRLWPLAAVLVLALCGLPLRPSSAPVSVGPSHRP